MRGKFIAVDWGTTNRRLFVIGEKGDIVHEENDDRGAVSPKRRDFSSETQALRDRFGALPIICAGMVGSSKGWVELPYVPLPGSIAQLAAAAHWIEPQRTAIITGMSTIVYGRADVMRGEEVQFLGAAASGLIADDDLLCQPGTHCKWARVNRGHISGFTTAMTGEIFALLSTHGLLASLIEGEAKPSAVFYEGVHRATANDFLADLFEVRAASLLGTRQTIDNAAYLSGLLIGSDVQARIDQSTGVVYVLSDSPLGSLYCAAIESKGAIAKPVDSRAAFVSGITAIWEKMT